MVALGVYLAFTAICEVTECWSLVFPRYIADPNFGIHFGRGRGPDLNSVSLGVFLTACAMCAWLLLPQVRRRWQQLAILAAMPLMALGVLLTFTRSAWIGFAAAAMVVAEFQMPRRWRMPAVGCGVLAGMLIACLSWNQLVGIQRDGTAADAEHSVDQRASFAYVSWQMVCDHPIMGVGFGRFYDAKLPYLSDRRQNIELESIRGLHHHNTLLSVLTETGMVGLAAFIAVIVAWARCAWKLATSAESTWVRTHGVLMIAIVANYLCSAAFHDLTLLPSQELLLFVMAGLTVNLHQVAFGTGLSVRSTQLLYSSACPVRTS
jgi:O-antigen ligase